MASDRVVGAPGGGSRPAVAPLGDDGCVADSIPALVEPAVLRWTRRRLEIRRWLATHAEPLEPLFAGAVELVDDPNSPGRAYLLSHCMREICNRLPDYYPGAAIGDSKQVQYTQHLDQLTPIWEAEGFPVDGTLPRVAGTVSNVETQGIEMPLEVIRRVSELISEHIQGRRRGAHAAEQLFAAAARAKPGDQRFAPNVELWRGLGKWAVGRAHAPRTGPLREADDLEEMFDVLEIALASLLGSAAEAMDELDELLAETNT